MEKHSVSRLSYLFAHLYLLSSDSFSSHLLSSNLPLLSASPLLCFSSVHIVGSLTSKLPSITVSCVFICYHVLSFVFTCCFHRRSAKIELTLEKGRVNGSEPVVFLSLLSIKITSSTAQGGGGSFRIGNL